MGSLLQRDEFIRAYCELSETNQEALGEFIDALTSGSVESALENITNKSIRDKFRQILNNAK